MEPRRSARWSLASPLVRVVLTLVFLSGLGIALAPQISRNLSPSLASFFSGFRAGLRLSDSHIEQERNQLRDQLKAVNERLLEAEQRLEMAEAIGKLEGFTRERRFDPLYAQVVSYSPDPGIQTMTVNRGEKDGVKTGLAAVSGDGFVVGVVRRVTAATSTILLITDPQARLVAKIRNEAESRGLVAGEQGLSIRMSFIPKHQAITTGQLIVTSGADQSIPVDLPIGTVGAIGPQTGDLFQSAAVISPIDIQNLDVVAIVPSAV